ncbi:tRNA/rRNA methyltransferase, SpoU [Cynara cardunculus var. scolymus]|uniref:tRNA/rRNA methyltransferase, SpoU n=1 Tax=Cynara cardunculus var. scolymus TaxID=59895 RepID=A0A103XK55_CYNCS|nr:tRNA/rRNA methyltransferase, SpoU [Cynara cardunculus var. scolymus]
MWLSSSSFPQSSPLFLCKQHLHSSLSLIQPPKSQNGDPKEATPSKILPFHVKSITSTSNPFVKHCVKLRNSSSYRHSHGSVLLVGTTPLRTLDGVFLLPGCCDPFNEKALRASRGAALQLPIVCGQWSHLQSFVDGIQMKIIAGHPGGNDEQKSVSFLSHEFASSLTDTKLCLVLGSEGSGLSEKAKRVSELLRVFMWIDFLCNSNKNISEGVLK